MTRTNCCYCYSMHHRRRYRRYPALAAVGVLREPDAEQERALVRALEVHDNMHLLRTAPLTGEQDALLYARTRCFVTVAETLNFRIASGRVGLSPGAFSVRVKQLEEQLGRELLNRTTRSVRLTDAGARRVSAGARSESWHALQNLVLKRLPG